MGLSLFPVELGTWRLLSKLSDPVAILLLETSPLPGKKRTLVTTWPRTGFNSVSATRSFNPNLFPSRSDNVSIDSIGTSAAHLARIFSYSGYRAREDGPRMSVP